MTTPAAAITVLKQGYNDLIGRLYPTLTCKGTYNSTIRAATALKGLRAGDLCPSTTNVIGVNGVNLAGWAGYEARRHFTRGLELGREDLDDLAKEASTKYERISKEAADRGTETHAGAERFYNGEPAKKIVDSFTMGAGPYFEQFLKWHAAWQPRMVMQEFTVFGEINGLPYAGTVDALAEIDGELWLLDWKTSKKMRTKVAMQLAAAKNATHYADPATGEIKEMPQVHRMAGVLLTDEVQETYEVNNYEHALTTFGALRTAWEWTHVDGEHEGQTALTVITPQPRSIRIGGNEDQITIPHKVERKTPAYVEPSNKYAPAF